MARRSVPIPNNRYRITLGGESYSPPFQTDPRYAAGRKRVLKRANDCRLCAAALRFERLRLRRSGGDRRQGIRVRLARAMRKQALGGSRRHSALSAGRPRREEAGYDALGPAASSLVGKPAHHLVPGHGGKAQRRARISPASRMLRRVSVAPASSSTRCCCWQLRKRDGAKPPILRSRRRWRHAGGGWSSSVPWPDTTRIGIAACWRDCR